MSVVPYSMSGALQRVQDMNVSSNSEQNEVVVRQIATAFGNTAGAIIDTFKRSQEEILKAQRILEEKQNKLSDQMIERLGSANPEDLDKISESYDRALKVFSDNTQRNIGNIVANLNQNRDTAVNAGNLLVAEALETKVKLIAEQNKEREILLTQAKAAVELEQLEAEERRADLIAKADRLTTVYNRYRETYDRLVNKALEKMGDPSYQLCILTTTEPRIDWEKGEVYEGKVEWRMQG